MTARQLQMAIAANKTVDTLVAKYGWRRMEIAPLPEFTEALAVIDFLEESEFEAVEEACRGEGA